jgi:uncharacterized Tic20 family protein
MSQLDEAMTPPPPPSGTPSAEEKQWAMFAHLSALAGGLRTGAFGGWGFFLGPLVLWILTVVTLFIGALLTFPLMGIVGIGALVLIVIASMKANEGVAYRYPFTIRLIK